MGRCKAEGEGRTSGPENQGFLQAYSLALPLLCLG